MLLEIWSRYEGFSKMSHPVRLQPTTLTVSVAHICRQEFCIPDIAHDLVLRHFLAKTLLFCNNLKKSQLLLLLHDLAAWSVLQLHSWVSQALQNKCLDGPWDAWDLYEEGDPAQNQKSHLWSQMWTSKFCFAGKEAFSLLVSQSCPLVAHQCSAKPGDLGESWLPLPSYLREQCHRMVLWPTKSFWKHSCI